MSDDAWSRLFEIFDAASEVPAEERAAYVAEACGADAELRREVEELLRSHEELPGPLDRPESLEPLLDQPPAEEVVGKAVGPYEIESVIGEGGMGIVCAARQRAPIERRVALKLIKVGMDTGEVVRRFSSERQTLAAMDHPNIAKVHDAGATEEGRPYFVMELIEGMPITDYCDRRRLSVRKRLELLSPVCEAVQHAHQRGIIHRDLKPSNVLVAEHEGKAVPKVIDFGIAKATDPRLARGTQLTRQGVFVGTPEYMSPEQAGSGLDVDIRSDVYSLGVLLYRLLTGALPFGDASESEIGPAELQRRVREEDPPTPSTRVSKLGAEAASVAQLRRTKPKPLRQLLTGELDWITMKAMAKERDLRYGSATELAADLERFLNHQPIEAGPPSAHYRARKFVRRHRLGVAAASLLALVVSVAGVAITVQSFHLARALATAEAEREVAEEERLAAEAAATFLARLFRQSRPIQGGQVLSVRELLDRGAEQIAADLQGQDEVRARVLASLGGAYVDLAEYDRGEELLREAYEVRGRLPESDRTSQLLEQLADLHRFRGELEVAETHLRKALEIHRRIGGSATRSGSILADLGSIVGQRGEWGEAEKLVRESLSLLSRHAPDDHARIATGEGQLATILHRQGRYNEAIDAYRTSLSEWRAVGGEDARLGHPLQNLGALLVDRGAYQEAEPLLREALALRRKNYGAEHPAVATVLNNLALLHNQTGDYAAAAELYLEALAINRQAYGERHMAVAINVNNLGLAYLEAGNLADAEVFLDQALALQRELAGEDHPDVAYPLTNLARVYQESSRALEAERAYREALALRRARLPEGHPQLAGSLVWLGGFLSERGDSDEAEPLLREAVEIRRAKLDATDWRIAEAESLWGGSLARLRRFDEAERLVVEGYERLLEARGPEWRGTREGLERVVELYELWGKESEAQRYRALSPRPHDSGSR